MRLSKLIAATAFTISISTVAAPVWKVEKDNNQVFLGGTVHSLSEAEYPLPDTFSNVYERADEVYFEFDMSKLNSPELRSAIINELTYKNGGSIADDLKADTLTSLKASLNERGLTYEQLAGLKASLLGLTLNSVETQRLGLKGKGVDTYFHELASEEGKPIGWLESLDDQVATLASFGAGQEDEYIRYILDTLDDKMNIITDMERGWRQADIELLNTKLLSPMQHTFPDVYESAVIKRNEAWLPKIEAMLDDKDTELVLVGVLHFVGEHSILRQLEAKGYKVSRL